MAEISRVLLSRMTVTLFVFLLILNMLFAFAQCSSQRENTQTEGYDAFLESVQENADRMLLLGLLQKGESFASRNIKKTAADFRRLQAVKIEPGENRGIVTYANYHLNDVLILIFALYLVMQLRAEKKRGLHLLVRSTRRGRAWLAMVRIAIFLAGTAIACVALCAGSLCAVSLIYPGADWSRSIQSVPAYMKCAYDISIGTYLLRNVFGKICAAWLFGLLFYALSEFFLSALGILLFLGSQITFLVLYRLIIPTSRLAVLKFLNLYALLMGGGGFSDYINLNVFGRPIGVYDAQLLFIGIAVLLLVLLVFAECAFLPTQRKQPFAGQIETVQSWFSKRRRCPGIVVWEIRKVLLSQNALWILLLAVYLVFSASQEMRYVDLRNPYELRWYEVFEGELDAQKESRMQAQMEVLVAKKERYERAYERNQGYLQKHLTEGKDTGSILAELGKLETAIREKKKEIAGLQRVMENAGWGLSLAKENGRKVHLIEPYSYQLLLFDDAKTTFRNTLYLMLAIVIGFSGVNTMEKTSHMQQLLHTQYRGRAHVLLSKVLLTALVAGGLALSIHMIQFVQIGNCFPYRYLDADVESIQGIRHILVPMSIRTYLILRYAGMSLAAAGAGLGMLLLGRFCRDRVSCMGAGIVVFVIPLVLFSIL